jgi:DNA-binding MarR family transcriptional regulator
VEADVLATVRRSLVQLFRLGGSRKVHALQAAAAGMVITSPGVVLLTVLAVEGPLSLSDLARRAEMDPGAASRQVKALEADGLVERSGREGDARVQILQVTPAGRRGWRRIADVQDRHMADALDGWSTADREQFARLLQRFVDDLRSVDYRPGPDQRRSA